MGPGPRAPLTNGSLGGKRYIRPRQPGECQARVVPPLPLERCSGSKPTVHGKMPTAPVLSFLPRNLKPPSMEALGLATSEAQAQPMYGLLAPKGSWRTSTGISGVLSTLERGVRICMGSGRSARQKCGCPAGFGAMLLVPHRTNQSSCGMRTHQAKQNGKTLLRHLMPGFSTEYGRVEPPVACGSAEPRESSAIHPEGSH